MAESAVTFLFDRLSLLLQGLHGGIGNNAGQMRALINSFELLTKKKKVIPNSKNGSSKYAKSLETLKIFLKNNRDSNGFNHYIKRMYASVTNLTVRHQVASEFQKIRLRVENVSKNGQKYRDMYDFMDEGSSNQTYDTRGDSLLLEETNVLGIEKPKKQLADWLMQSDDGLKVISVVGMGGLGKTTLVKKICDGDVEKLPQWTHFLQGLTQVFLSWSRLKDELHASPGKTGIL